MTLGQFKNRLKIATILVIATVNAVAFYSVGRLQGADSTKPKEVSAKVDEKSKFEAPMPYADIQSAKVISNSVKLCANTVYGFEIAYPADWFTTYNQEDQKCRFFASYSFVIPAFTEVKFVPLEVEPFASANWQSNVSLYENPNEFQNIEEVQSIEVNGKFVKRIEGFSTGAGLIARGHKIITYLVFGPTYSTRVTYQQIEEDENTEAAEFVAAEIVDSINYY